MEVLELAQPGATEGLFAEHIDLNTRMRTSIVSELLHEAMLEGQDITELAEPDKAKEKDALYERIEDWRHLFFEDSDFEEGEETIRSAIGFARQIGIRLVSTVALHDNFENLPVVGKADDVETANKYAVVAERYLEQREELAIVVRTFKPLLCPDEHFATGFTLAAGLQLMGIDRYMQDEYSKRVYQEYCQELKAWNGILSDSNRPDLL
jgi:hypothetical protein